MDQFGVLVESIGFRPHGKSSTPMSQLKPNPKSNFAHRSDASSFRDPYSFSPIVDQLDGIFRSNTQKPNQSQNISVVDDIFGGPLSNNSNSSLDLRNYAGSNGYGDLIGSKSTQKDPVFDDLFGSFGLNASSSNQAKKGSGLDDLIPGFIGASQSKNRIFSPTKSNVRPSNSSSTKIDDPFSIFETSVSRSQSDTSWPFNEPSGQDKGKSSVQSTTNGFNGFLMGGPPKSGSKVGIRTTVANKPSSNGFENAKYVDSIFGSNNAGSTAQNSLFDSLFREEEHAVKQTSSQSSSFSTKNPTSVTSIGDDFTSLFGDVAMSTGEFREIAGEPAERRRARLNRYTKTNERMAEALAEKNQRDLQIQREQEEKRRIAETLDGDIKRWAAGKEGNLRALLASLQQVLGHESGWRPVPLTDLITSDSVKKVYKKATLYVHPDKVQQRGANLHHKYIAEKVFDILKEASNKFSAEELC